MNRKRRPRKNSGSNQQKSAQPATAGQNQKSGPSKAIPTSHKRAGRNRGKNQGGNGQKGRTSEVQAIAPAPLVSLHRIGSSSPVGTGLNPLAQEFMKKPPGSSNPAPSKFYRVLFYDTFKSAKDNASAIKEACSGCDQLNVVIKAEGNMNDPELCAIDVKVKLFAGEAWSLIHERRVEEGWYEAAQ